MHVCCDPITSHNRSWHMQLCHASAWVTMYNTYVGAGHEDVVVQRQHCLRADAGIRRKAVVQRVVGFHTDAHRHPGFEVLCFGCLQELTTDASDELPQLPAMHLWDSTLRIALIHTHLACPVKDRPRPYSRRSGPPRQRHIVSSAERICAVAAAVPNMSAPAV